MVSAELMTGLGCALSIFLCSIGACFASIPAGMIAMKSKCSPLSFAPIMSSGVLAIYGIWISIMLVYKLNNDAIVMNEKDGYKYFSAGLTNGLANLVCGISMSHFFLLSLCPKTMMKSSCPTAAANTTTTTNEQEQPLIEGSSSNNNDDDEKTPLPPPSKRFLTVMIFHECIGFYGFIIAYLLIASG